MENERNDQPGFMLANAKQLFGKNFIGAEELGRIASRLNIQAPGLEDIPSIPFSEKILNQTCNTHLLFLGTPFDAAGDALTLVKMRDFFGMEPSGGRPCFYNQDWYVKEAFANESRVGQRWYLLGKDLLEESRGKQPLDGQGDMLLPTALVCAYAFFAWYFHSGEILWNNDFVWCADTDANGDRIYAGRYNDPAGIAKDGFSIHRHLRIREHYGSVNTIF